MRPLHCPLVVLLPRLPATVGGETTATVLLPPVEGRRLAGTLGTGLVRFELGTGLTLDDTFRHYAPPGVAVQEDDDGCSFSFSA